jgi:hypothetical protein
VRIGRSWLLGGLIALALVLAVLALREALVETPPAEVPASASRAATPYPPAAPSRPTVIDAVPLAPKATLHVGNGLDFAVVARGADLRFGWTVDGAPAGTGPRWTYTPGADAVGRHRIEVRVGDRVDQETRRWGVRVRPARPPRILTARPDQDTLEVVSGEALRLTVAPAAATARESVQTRWTVDGAPAGEGPALTFRPTRPGVASVRAEVRSDLGGGASHDWRVRVLEPPPPPERPPAPAQARPVPPPAVASPPSPPPAASGNEEVRHWLDRYAAAWHMHDVEMLRQLGQVSTDDEVAALRRYFDRVRELDVELDVVAIELRGDRAVVRFVRRDRFRDPAGRLVRTESPLIEKQLVRTPDGLRAVRAAPPA